ncbi:MAG: hypothetical protein V2A34_07495 [Lentisphaerota bacterium]
MNQTANLQKFATKKEAIEHFKQQLAQYLGHLPGSTLSLHRWMKRLEAAGAGIIVAAFLVALYVSIAWKNVNPLVIPIAWFVFAASVTPAMIFVGLDAIILRAFPPVELPGKLPKFVTGSRAVWTGSALILPALVSVVFWGVFAYAVATLNWALITLLINILGVIMGIGFAVSIILKLVRNISRSR